MARVRESSLETCAELRSWEMAEVPAGAAQGPAGLEKLSPRWEPAQVPGSVGSSLRANGRYEPLHGPRLDDSDWWFRCKLSFGEARLPRALRFEGLATLCSGFLDGAPLFTSDNMFLAREVELPAAGPGERELLLCFHSVGAALKQRRPRPRWKVRLIESQNLRFLRTATFGRVPLWALTAPVIGPWRPASLVERKGARIEQADVRATALGAKGGELASALRLSCPPGGAPRKATLRAGGAAASLAIEASGPGQVSLRGTLALPDAAHWWPHTHGAQPLYPVSVELDGERIELGRTGFRRVELVREGGGFELRINGTPLFCRGACWTTANLLTLAGDPGPLLRDARDAGMNLVRVTGFGVYESDRFYELCDELGLLVWQDFMFGNQDYPAGDAAFAASVRAEAGQQLSRLQLSPSLAVLCGASEVRQAATMNGTSLSPECAQLFAETLAGLSRALRPDVPYVESSTTSAPVGARMDDGPSHYFGVGGYLRPVSEIRRNGVRFASECLAFGHVPADRTLDELLPAGAGVVQHPAWKLGMPRDAATGWDFDDVREHYLRELFGRDPVRLRWEEPARYLEASRVTTGELLVQAIAEMRAAGSPCTGALLWTLSDLLPGAGWGLIDAAGRRKAAWYFARRAFTSRLHLTDEGLNGLRLHALNEGTAPVEALLRIRCLREGATVVASGERELVLLPGQTAAVDVELLLGHFFDSAYAYRFGPPGFEFAFAELVERATGARLGEASFFPGKLPLERDAEPALVAQLAVQGPGSALLSLRCERVAHWVALDAGAWVPEDNYFHLVPGTPRTVRLSAPAGAAAPEVAVQPFNARHTVRVRPAAEEAAHAAR